jgi:hypothetical protein
MSKEHSYEAEGRPSDRIPESYIEHAFPALDLPKIPTMDKKLIIEATIPGWQPIKWYRDRGVKNLPPITVEEQAQAIADCVNAGATIIHTHPRDPNIPTESWPGGMPVVDLPLLLEIQEKAFAKAGDFITMNHAWSWDLSKSPYTDYITEAKEILRLANGSNKYLQGSVIMTWGLRNHMLSEHGGPPFIEGIKWLEAHDIKPIYQMHMYRFMVIKRMLFDSGVSTWRPYIINIHCGKHTDEQLDLDPWGHIQIIKDMEFVRHELGNNEIIGIYAGNRNWMPISVTGIMNGADIVRVGIEDQYWLWPHRDDISTYAAQTTELIVNIARSLGREIATTAEAREILGMKLT